LKWLDRYERQPGEEALIGLILCAGANREKVELLELDKAGIVVAEYWTAMPPKAEFDKENSGNSCSCKRAFRAAQKLLGDNTNVERQIDYFLEPKDDDDE
jgi:hypothetical protein